MGNGSDRVELARRHIQAAGTIALDETLRVWERSYVEAALQLTGGNLTQAARLLQITRDTLRYKMKKFNLK